jgi:hypothetical protein
MTKHAYLAAELDKHIAWFDKESTKHKNLSRRFRYCAFILTAAASVFAGLPVVFSEYQVPMSLLILVTTSTLTVVNSLEGLRKAGELWIHERTTLYRLHDLRRDLQFHSEDPSNPVDVDALYNEMQECLQSARDRWDRLVGKTPTTTEKTDPSSPARL